MFRNIRKDKNLSFNEEKHEYSYRECKMMSVTQLIKHFVPEFKREEILEKQSKKLGKSKESISAEWDEKRDYALDFGTKIHLYAENQYKGYENKPATDDKERAYRKTVDKYIAEHPNLRLVSTELQLCHPFFKLAGTVDLLLTDGEGKYFLYDWKTNKEINQYSKYKERMLAPFEHMDHCSFNTYQLQLNIYNVLLNKQGVYPTGLYIIHLKEDGYKEYKARFLIDETKFLMDWCRENVKNS